MDRQLGFVLREASVAVWNDVRRALEPTGLRPQTYATLLIIDSCDGCKQGDVADALGIRRSNMVALIDELVGQKVVTRAVNSGDRRSYSLSLTPEGLALLQKGRNAHGAHERRVAEALEGFDADAFLNVAARLSRF